MRFVSNAPEETYNLAKKVAKILPDGTVFCVRGDLGAGKTLFTQGLAAGLGVKDEVTSPTFSLLNIYDGEKRLFHFDLYRLDWAEQLVDIGFYEYSVQEGIVLIEWPDKFLDEMPENYIFIEIARGAAENERQLNFSVHGEELIDVFEEMKKIADFSD
jgi:tRNA threonylcarbamoyladenosine biosynthesis protein TsaE